MINPLQALKKVVEKQNQIKATAHDAVKNQLKVIEAAKKVSQEIKNGEG